MISTGNPSSNTRGDSVVRKYFDSSTDLYVDKYAAPYKVMCLERIGLLKDFLDLDSAGPMKILDVGCGAGIFIDMLLDQYPDAQAVGVDSSRGMLNRNVPHERKTLVLGDAKDLPFRLQSFDLINVDAVMHHLVDFRAYENTIGTIERFLLLLRGLLKPRGLLIVREIYHEFVLQDNLGSWLVYELSTLQLPLILANLLKRLGMETANAGVCFLTRRQWKNVFERTGYEVLQVRQKHWTKHYFEKMGFRFNGDLYYTLRSEANGMQAEEPSAHSR